MQARNGLVVILMAAGLICHYRAYAEDATAKARISLLGVEAVKICDGQQTVFIDAFADGIPPFSLTNADVILITHDDGDHFSSAKVAEAARTTGATVVGPPSIAYPLLAEQKLPPGQLAIIYPNHFKKPIVREIRGVKLKVYQTKHDGDWHPVHVSYLITMGTTKLYHTGDSSMIDEGDPDLKNLDVLFHVFNTKDASQVSQLEEVRRKLVPRCLIPIHLNCSWTMTTADFSREIERRKLEGFAVIGEKNKPFEIP